MVHVFMAMVFNVRCVYLPDYIRRTLKLSDVPTARSKGQGGESEKRKVDSPEEAQSRKGVQPLTPERKAMCCV